MSKNTDTISGLRFQKYDTGEIHIHDDARNLKFMASLGFKTDLKDALNELSKHGDHVLVLDGTSKEELCLIKKDKKVHAFIMDDKDTLNEIKAFQKTL